MDLITIVDDSDDLRFLLSLLLEDELGTTCLAVDSLAGVQRRAEEVLGSQAVILDINLGLGEPDGVAVYEWLRAQKYRGGICFLTGHAMDSPFVRGAVETGIPIFEKPMALEEFIPMIRGCLANLREMAKEG